MKYIRAVYDDNVTGQLNLIKGALNYVALHKAPLVCSSF